MTIEINKRVDVQVSLGTLPLETQSFDTPFFLVGTAAFTEAYRVYGGIDEVLDDHAEGSAAYKMAALAFNGLFPPTEVYIGRRAITVNTITPTVADNTTYSLNIKAGGVDAFITYTSGTSASVSTIVTGLKAAITASAVNTLVTVGGTTTLTLTPLTTLSVGTSTSNLVNVLSYSETATTAASRARQLDTAWYYVAMDDHTASEVEAFAAYAEGINCPFATSTSDVNVYSQVATTDIGSKLKALGFDHASTLFHESADTAFPEAAIFGAMAQLEKGTSTLTDKTLVGVATSNLSSSQIAVLEDKNVMYYINFVGAGSLFNSKTASGQFFDTIEFADWLRARVAESVYGTIKRRSVAGLKTSYDQAGKAIVEQAILSPVKTGQAVGSISVDTDPVVRIPSRAEISDNDRANRFLPNVVLEVQYTNAIETVQIRAYVSI